MKRQGWDVFLDTRNIEIGDALPQNIAEGIENCDGMIVIYTMNYCTSAWCPKELDYAVDRNKKIFPLKRQNVEYDRGSSVAWHLNSLLYREFWEDGKYEESFIDLTSAINKVDFFMFMHVILYFSFRALASECGTFLH